MTNLEIKLLEIAKNNVFAYGWKKDWDGKTLNLSYTIVPTASTYLLTSKDLEDTGVYKIAALTEEDKLIYLPRNVLDKREAEWELQKNPQFGAYHIYS